MDSDGVHHTTNVCPTCWRRRNTGIITAVPGSLVSIQHVQEIADARKANEKRFLREVRHNSVLTNTVSLVLFKELIRRHRIASTEFVKWSSSGIMKTSFIDNIEAEPGFVTIAWPKGTQIDELLEDNG